MQRLRRVVHGQLSGVPVICCAILWLLQGATSAGAQDLFNQEAVLDPFFIEITGNPTFAANHNIGVIVAIDGDTAIAVQEFFLEADATYHWRFAYLYERDPGSNTWRRVTELVLSQWHYQFRPYINDVAISGNTAVVAGTDYTYIFERNHGGPNAWGEVTWLRQPNGNTVGSASDVAISGNTVAAAIPEGGVQVFERNQGGAEAWGHVAALSAGLPTAANTVAISADTILVGAVEGTVSQLIQQVNVFERNQGGANAWGWVTRLPYSYSPPPVAGTRFCLLGLDDGCLPPIDIDGNTAVVGGNQAPHVFERNRSGANAWGELMPSPGAADASYTSKVAIDGDLIMAVSPGTNGYDVARAYSRNQNGMNAWGAVSAPTVQTSGQRFFHLAVAISGDTVLVGAPESTYWLFFDGDGLGAGAEFVFGADVDGDGIRDGLDPCPRDPLNNIAGSCRRAIGASPVVDDVITLSNMTTASVHGEMTVTATFTNTGQAPIRNPFYTVAELSGGNVLKNADGGPGGVGATLSPDVGNGVLEPGEQSTVTFVIGLASRKPFRFVVHVQGDPQQ